MAMATATKPAKARSPKAQRARRLLSEDIAYSSTLKVDREAGIIHGVKVCGLESKNGRRYPLETLREALSMYDGAPCHVDHGDSKADDVLGKFVNPRLEADGVYADLHYLTKHPMAERLCEAAERMPSVLGFSHNADGDGEFADGVWVVRKIVEVRSIDLVAKPATTNGIFEGRTMSKTLKEYLADRKQNKIAAKWLKEMDGDPALDMPVAEPPAEGGDHKADLLAAIAKLLDSSDPADVEMANKIFALLKKSVSPDAPADDAAATEEEDSAADDGKSDDEKKKDDATESLRKELDRVKNDLAVRDLCESVGLIPSAVQRKALAAMTEEADRKALAESFTQNTLLNRSRARSAPPAGVGAGDVPSVEEAIKNGRYRD